MSEQQSERERFEAWAKQFGLNMQIDLTEGCIDYYKSATHYAWLGWQARAALSKPSTEWTHEINQELERQYLKGFQAGKAFEREQCALVCDGLDLNAPNIEERYAFAEAAAAIRSRKDAP